VLDTCMTLLLLKEGEKADTVHISTDDISLVARTSQFRNLAIDTIICGAVSEQFFNLLRQSGINVIMGICGNIDEVIAAHHNGLLGTAKFRMPGFE